MKIGSRVHVRYEILKVAFGCRHWGSGIGIRIGIGLPKYRCLDGFDIGTVVWMASTLELETNFNVEGILPTTAPFVLGRTGATPSSSPSLLPLRAPQSHRTASPSLSRPLSFRTPMLLSPSARTVAGDGRRPTSSLIVAESLGQVAVAMALPDVARGKGTVWSCLEYTPSVL